MALTPILAETVKIGEAAAQEREATVQPSRTYKVDWNSGRITGHIDGVEALKQAIYKILQTERFAFLIYSWNYGFEMSRLLGQDHAIVTAETEGLIAEALTEDDRIESITNFKIEVVGKRNAAVSFTAVSIFGEIDITTEVTL